jgi:hypothetical protein
VAENNFLRFVMQLTRGHVVKTGEGFHYIPEPMTMVL